MVQAAGVAGAKALRQKQLGMFKDQQEDHEPGVRLDVEDREVVTEARIRSSDVLPVR